MHAAHSCDDVCGVRAGTALKERKLASTACGSCTNGRTPAGCWPQGLLLGAWAHMISVKIPGAALEGGLLGSFRKIRLTGWLLTPPLEDHMAARC